MIGVVGVAAVGLGMAPGIASARPQSPSDAQIGAAQQAKQDAAAQVGAINAALAQAQAAADSASAAANIALQDYEDKQAAYDQARTAADAAAAAAAQAEVDLQGGRDQVVQFARDSYMRGTTDPGMSALLSSGGPAQMLERAALLDAVADHRVDVVAQLTVLEQQATAADQAAQQTVAQADALQAEAATLLAAAQDQEAAARSQADSLSAQQDQVEAQLATAQQNLDGLQSLREAAEAYAAQQQAAAAARPSSTAPAPSGSGSSASSGGSSSGGSSSGSTVASPKPAAAPPPATTTAGAPSGSAVDVAIAAAKSQRGLPYSWGGGGSNGPGYGIPPDTDIWGFDCSGLTQYAYAQAGIQIGGTSRDQWYRFRNQTVAREDLQPGDLVFWASGSSYTSIYHVALYIGNKQVVQAPQSGDVVKISGMWFGNDYWGAVRPTG